MKTLKDHLLTKPANHGPTDMLEAVGNALRESLSEEQVKSIVAWLSKNYSAGHAEVLEKALKRNYKAKSSQPTQNQTKQAKQTVEISDKKVLRSQKDKNGPSQKSKRKGKKATEANDSQVSNPAQSEGTFTNTEMNFLNDTQDLAENKKIDTTMSVQAMHN